MNRVIFWVVVVLGTLCLVLGAASWLLVSNVRESPTVGWSNPAATNVKVKGSTAASPAFTPIEERPAPVANEAKTEKSANKRD